MAVAGRVDIIADLNAAGVKRGAAEAKNAIGGIGASVDSLKSVLGGRGTLKDVLEVARGGGAIGGMVLAAATIRDVAKASLELKNGLADGSLAAGELGAKLISALPAGSIFVEAGAAINEILTGNVAYLKAVEDGAAMADVRMKALLESSQRLRLAMGDGLPKPTTGETADAADIKKLVEQERSLRDRASKIEGEDGISWFGDPGERNRLLAEADKVNKAIAKIRENAATREQAETKSKVGSLIAYRIEQEAAYQTAVFKRMDDERKAAMDNAKAITDYKQSLEEKAQKELQAEVFRQGRLTMEFQADSLRLQIEKLKGEVVTPEGFAAPQFASISEVGQGITGAGAGAMAAATAQAGGQYQMDMLKVNKDNNAKLKQIATLVERLRIVEAQLN